MQDANVKSGAGRTDPLGVAFGIEVHEAMECIVGDRAFTRPRVLVGSDLPVPVGNDDAGGTNMPPRGVPESARRSVADREHRTRVFKSPPVWPGKMSLQGHRAHCSFQESKRINLLILGTTLSQKQRATAT